MAGTGGVATGGGVEVEAAVGWMTAGLVVTGAGAVTAGAGVVTAGASEVVPTGAGVVTAGAGGETVGGARVVAPAAGAVGEGDVVPDVLVPLHAVNATPNIAAPTRNFLIHPPHVTGEPFR